jgi:hypothetical protein
MPPNPSFRRALLALSHPLSIAAIVLLLINDHIWRKVAPSWLTGKIGDAAWLVFAPFLVAAILAWLLPLRLKRRDEIIGHGAIIVVGLVFAGAKTIPAFHSLTIKVLETLTGWPNVLRMDPTDLIALPVLLIAWLIWQQSAARSIHLPKRGWVLLPLAVLATMADSPAQLYGGIRCVKVVGSAIDASGYVSRDGGLTWQDGRGGGSSLCAATVPPSPWQLSDPTNERVQYRFTPGVSIERSSNWGRSWTTELTLTGDDARLIYFQKTSQLYSPYPVGPVKAVFHEPTGNIVAAMGHEGVLVRTPDGIWHWVAVDNYHMPDMHQVENIITILSGELLYALALVGLVSGTVARRPGPGPARKLETLRLILVGLAWLGWIMAVVFFPPAPSGGYYATIISVMAAMAVAVLAVPMMLGQIYGLLTNNRRMLLPTLGIANVSAVLFVLPYVVWSQGGLPFYNSAMLYALVLVAVTLIAGRRYLQRYFPTSIESARHPGQVIKE